MNATPRPSLPSTATLAAGAVTAIAALAALTAAAPARAAVYADVVSSTPVTAFVPVQRRDCDVVERRSAESGAVDPNSQPVGDSAGTATRCRTVNVRTQRVVAYDVVYEIAGARQTVRLDRDPGSHIELGVVAQAGTPVGRPVGRVAGTPVERPIGQPVPSVTDDGGPVAAAPTYAYGEQAPIGVRAPQTTTTVIVDRPYGYGYGSGWYDPYPYGYSYGYPWYAGPTIGIGFWGGHRWGGGRGRWDGGPRHRFPHRVGGGPAARR